MIEKKIKTLFHDLAPLHEKYIKKALDKKEGIRIIKGGEVMEIPYKDLKKNIVKRTKKKLRDKYGGDPYHLFYLNWEPQSRQEKLFNDKQRSKKDKMTDKEAKEFSKNCL